MFQANIGSAGSTSYTAPACFGESSNSNKFIFTKMNFGKTYNSSEFDSCYQNFYLELGPKAKDVRKPVNPLLLLSRVILGTIAATYYVLVSIYMWIKDKIVPKGMPI